MSILHFIIICLSLLLIYECLKDKSNSSYSLIGYQQCIMKKCMGALLLADLNPWPEVINVAQWLFSSTVWPIQRIFKNSN